LPVADFETIVNTVAFTGFARTMPLKTSSVARNFSPGPCLTSALAIAFLAFPLAAKAQTPTPLLLDAMTTELHRAFSMLGKQAAASPDAEKQLPPYFLSYSVADATSVSIRAQFGAVVDSSSNHVRVADVQIRLGSANLDNTHGNHRGSAVNTMQLPLVDDRTALSRTLWLATNIGYGTALDNYLRVKTEAQVRAKE
jgi:TldD protein